jgi:predicted ArsR family transcriptional regulator
MDQASVEASADPAMLPALDEDEFSSQIAALTAVFGDPTRRRIYLYAREGRGVTAADVGQRFDLHPNVARHHLDKLASAGYLVATLDRASAVAGRPSKRYRAAAEAPNVPTPRDDLIVLLLSRALAAMDCDAAEALAESVGEEYGRKLGQQISPGDTQRTLKTALQAVADAFTAHGFEAHAEARGSSLAVVVEHCPFGSTASGHPVICAVDRGMVRGMLDVLHGPRPAPLTVSSRARGDSVCKTIV